MRIAYRQASRDDVTRQFRYYLVELDTPEVAVRFKEAVRKTAKAISQQPSSALPLTQPATPKSSLLAGGGFWAIRFYFLVEDETIRVIRILHGKRNVRGILEQERIAEK